MKTLQQCENEKVNCRKLFTYAAIFLIVFCLGMWVGGSLKEKTLVAGCLDDQIQTLQTAMSECRIVIPDELWANFEKDEGVWLSIKPAGAASN